MLGPEGVYGKGDIIVTLLDKFESYLPWELEKVGTKSGSEQEYRVPEDKPATMRIMIKTQANLPPHSKSVDGRKLRNVNECMRRRFNDWLALCLTTNCFQLSQSFPKIIFHEDKDGVVNEALSHHITDDGQLEALKALSDPDPAVVNYIGFTHEYITNLVNIFDWTTTCSSKKDREEKWNQINSTPRCAWNRFKQYFINLKTHGIVDDWVEYERSGRNAIFVNEFVFIWPLICREFYATNESAKGKKGKGNKKAPQHHVQIQFHGTSKETFKFILLELDLVGEESGYPADVTKDYPLVVPNTLA